MNVRRSPWLPVALSLLLPLSALAASAKAGAKAAPKPAGKPAAKKAPSKGGSFFRLDKIKSTFSHSCGFRVAGSEKGSTERRVILASVPLDCAAADRELDPVSFLESAIGEAKGAYVSLNVSADGSRIDGSWRSTEPSDAFSFGGQGEVKLTRNDETRIEGRYRTLEPESFFDKFFEFDLTIAVDLLAGSLAGEPLPQGGGEPGKAYAAYLKAVAKEDPAGLQKLVVKTRAQEIAQEVEMDAFKAMFELTKSQELKTWTISGGLLKGDRATLDVEGKSFDGDKMRGQVFLRKEDGAWKVADKKIRMVND
jgi:hypothetical protein